MTLPFGLALPNHDQKPKPVTHKISRREVMMIVRTLLVAAVVGLAGFFTAKLAPVASGACASDDGPKSQITTNAELARFISGISPPEGVPRANRAAGRTTLEYNCNAASRRPRSGGRDEQARSREGGLEGRGARAQCAELELKVYVEQTVPELLATYEKELAEAEADLKQAKANRVTAVKRFDTIKRLLTDSASDLSLRFRFEVGGLRAELEERRAGFAIEQVESKRKVLKEYEKDKQTNELRSKIEKARSEELRAKAVLELGDGMLNHLRTAIQKNRFNPSQTRLLGLLDQAAGN